MAKGLFGEYRNAAASFKRGVQANMLFFVGATVMSLNSIYLACKVHNDDLAEQYPHAEAVSDHIMIPVGLCFVLGSALGLKNVFLEIEVAADKATKAEASSHQTTAENRQVAINISDASGERRPLLGASQAGSDAEAMSVASSYGGVLGNVPSSDVQEHDRYERLLKRVVKSLRQRGLVVSSAAANPDGGGAPSVVNSISAV